MSEKINVQTAVLTEVNKVLNQGTNNFLPAFIYQEETAKRNEFTEEALDPNNFWVINKIEYVPTSYQWLEGAVVALPDIYDESGVIQIQWAIVNDQNGPSKVMDLDSFKRALRGYQGKIYAEDKKSSLGTKLIGTYANSSNLPNADSQIVGTYAQVIGDLGNLDRIYEVRIDKNAEGALPETKEWFNTYETLQEYEYDNLVLSLNSSPFNVDSQPYIMNGKRISIIRMDVPYRVHDGKNGSDNKFRIKPLTLDSDTRGDDDYIDLIHITRSNTLGIDTSANQAVTNKEIGLANTSTLFGSDFLLYDQENFLTDYLYNRTGRYKIDQETGTKTDMLTVSDPSKIFTIELTIGRRVYERDVVIDSIHYLDGIAERTMWSISLKTAKPKLVEARKAG